MRMNLFKTKTDYIILTLKKPNHLAILFYKDIKNKHIPFRYNNKWWQRDQTVRGWGETITYRFSKQSFLYSVQPFLERNSRFFYKTTIVATFDELLSEKEKECKISEIIL